MIRQRVIAVSIVTMGLWMAGVASAQQEAAIAGVARDTTGAVLPGVTVEATSPALIEKVRTAVTAGDGQYRLVDLRPGTYVVTFTLPGFNVVRREGIVLTTGFTATVNAEMRVGAVEETVTVTGATPVVDVQNVTRQQVMTSEVLEALPSAKSVGGLVALVPGVVYGGVNGNQDVGGTSGDMSTYMSLHGGRGGDMVIMWDGLGVNNAVIHSDPAAYTIYPNPAGMEEVALTTDNQPAEFDTAGVRINLVPKDGGNQFRAIFLGAYTNDSLQGSNLTDKLRARGIDDTTKINEIYDWNPGGGGPLMQDRLWFYTAHRWWGNSNQVAGLYENATGASLVYTPDFSKQVIDKQYKKSNALRLTWQVNPKNKLSFHYDRQTTCTCQNNLNGGLASIEAINVQDFPNNFVAQAKWSAPLSNNFLIDASWGMTKLGLRYSATTTADGFTPTFADIGVINTDINFRYRNFNNYDSRDDVAMEERVVASYITGGHALRFGLVNIHGYQQFFDSPVPLMVTYRSRAGAWNGVDYFAPAARGARDELKRNLGLFVQDQWTIDRLTLNMGARFTSFKGSIPEQTTPAGFGSPAVTFPAVDNAPNWKDVSVRGGVAYDVFGDGRTAIKASAGRYLRGEALQIAWGLNPLASAASVRRVTNREWHDLNGNDVADCDLANQAANGECGIGNFAFGSTVNRNRYADGTLEGWNKRGYNWLTGVGVQHEVTDGMSVSFDYHRRWYGNYMVRDNVLVDPGDYDPFCVTAPVDPALGSVSGSEICGLYDVTPSKFGRVDYEWTFAKDVGSDFSNYYDGFDVTVNARLPQGIVVQGGTSTGREIVDQCDVVRLVDNDEYALPLARGALFGISQRANNVSGMAMPTERFCRRSPPFQTQVKALAVIPLPYGITTTATIQNIPGIEVAAEWLAPRSVVSGLNRPLTTSTVEVQLIEPATVFEDRMTQLDLRVGKSFNVGRVRLQGNLDFFNLLNVDTVVRANSRYGSAWQVPSAVITGRFMKVSFQVNY